MNTFALQKFCFSIEALVTWLIYVRLQFYLSPSLYLSLCVSTIVYAVRACDSIGGSVGTGHQQNHSNNNTIT